MSKIPGHAEAVCESIHRQISEKTPGFVHIPDKKQHVKPFFNFREIKEGHNKGSLEIDLLTNDKKIIVPKDQIRLFPT